uniref:Uncharacterized protein n=1 Tax=Nelumbo nucifera TaxID=4432 RepID=A0A822YXS9_NELNU|nr:TPA_asm: hypothetical protein HUJ06_008123 [Nelumbo nucifera]
MRMESRRRTAIANSLLSLRRGLTMTKMEGKEEKRKKCWNRKEREEENGVGLEVENDFDAPALRSS